MSLDKVVRKTRIRNMIRRVLLLPDVHLTEEVPKPYKVVKKFMKDFKPHETVIMGDYMDMASLSHWDRDKRLSMEGKRYKSEVRVANKELDFLQENCKNITYLEGNHENWGPQYVQRNPELEGFIEPKEVLDIDARGIKWVPMNELYKMGHLYMTHGMYTNKYHANKHVQTLGCNIVYGHKHSFQQDMMVMKMQKPLIATGLGCLCGKDPSFMKGRPTQWINGFGVAFIESKTGYFTLYPINMVNESFLWNGKKYK